MASVPASTAGSQEPQRRLDLTAWEATGPNRALAVTDRPVGEPFDALRLRATPGEYEPASFVMRARGAIEDIELRHTALRSDRDANEIPPEAIELFVVKCWYQASDRTEFKSRGRFLVPELLLKDDALVEVDHRAKVHRIRVRHQFLTRYVETIRQGQSIPPGAQIRDADELQPFDLDADENKQIWLSVHVPAGTPAGTYSGTIEISARGVDPILVPVELRVLPFELDDPRLQIGLYYRGQTRSGRIPDRHNVWKPQEQYELELRDMYEHGIRYPTLHYWASEDRTWERIRHDLETRARIGFPLDPTYFIGVYPGTIPDRGLAPQLRQRIGVWVDRFAETGRTEIYFYGKDEAKGDALREQRLAWETVRETGARMFVAGNEELAESAADVLDVAVVSHDLDPAIPAAFHRHGNRVFSYANPQVGLEDPDRYRRNYGLRLWRAGYDGAMTYAYNDSTGDPWNDFDGSANHRDLMFTYPAEGRLIGTVQWEGYREGVDDLRYLATLEKRIASLANPRTRAVLEAWVDDLDVERPMSEVRGEIVEMILRVDAENARVLREATLPPDERTDP